MKFKKIIFLSLLLYILLELCSVEGKPEEDGYSKKKEYNNKEEEEDYDDEEEDECDDNSIDCGGCDGGCGCDPGPLLGGLCPDTGVENPGGLFGIPSFMQKVRGTRVRGWENSIGTRLSDLLLGPAPSSDIVNRAILQNMQMQALQRARGGQRAGRGRRGSPRSRSRRRPRRGQRGGQRNRGNRRRPRSGQRSRQTNRQRTGQRSNNRQRRDAQAIKLLVID